MRDPQELISWFGTPSWNDADAPLVCVHAFTGFLDAGQATEHAVRAIKGDSARLLVEFDPDELVDYRARRPSLTYVTDHFESVDWPQIGLYEVTDMNGRQFWLLTGPEPDYQWQRFVAAVTATDTVVNKPRYSVLRCSSGPVRHPQWRGLQRRCES